MIMPSQYQHIKSAGFTLVEVLFATAIAAMLASVISISLGVQSTLVETSQRTDVNSELSAFIDSVLVSAQTADIIAEIGNSPNDNSFSESESTENRKTLEVTLETIGTFPTTAQVVALTARSGQGELTRWIDAAALQ